MPVPLNGELVCYVLAKNEEANIGRCLRALQQACIPAVVLDSHSTDRTAEIARELGARVEDHDYTTHADALNLICASRTGSGELAMVLDADMVVPLALLSEARELILSGVADAVAAPIEMYWNGAALEKGSLCPPKPFMFRGGKPYFEPLGHGERLRPGVRLSVAKRRLIHNDLKPFSAYLDSQHRYSRNLVERARANQVSLHDRLRGTPVMMFFVPLFSYIFRGGIFCGRTGLGYALDRLIAEAIMFRQRIASDQRRGSAHIPEEK